MYKRKKILYIEQVNLTQLFLSSLADLEHSNLKLLKCILPGILICVFFISSNERDQGDTVFKWQINWRSPLVNLSLNNKFTYLMTTLRQYYISKYFSFDLIYI